MTQRNQQYWELGIQTLELIRSALNGTRPKLPESVDWELLLRFCQFHSVSSMAAMGLESCMERLPEAQAGKWRQEKEKAIRRTVLFETERSAITEHLEEIGCPHVCLKGSVLHKLYPRTGMRQMNDTDILIAASFRDQICRWMTERGYTVVQFGESHVDVYQKKPVFHFEIHTALYGGQRDAVFAEYYRDLERRLLAPGQESCCRQMSREDFCIYLMTHAYRHLTRRGIGIRNLVDLHIFHMAYGDPEPGYTASELKKLGIADFAGLCQSLSRKAFAEPDLSSKLTEEERKLLLVFFTSGTFGTEEQKVQAMVKEGASGGRLRKFCYLFSRLFPSMDTLASYHPELRDKPWKYPWIIMTRLIRQVIRAPERIRKEILLVFKKK